MGEKDNAVAYTNLEVASDEYLNPVLVASS